MHPVIASSYLPQMGVKRKRDQVEGETPAEAVSQIYKQHKWEGLAEFGDSLFRHDGEQFPFLSLGEKRKVFPCFPEDTVLPLDFGKKVEPPRNLSAYLNKLPFTLMAPSLSEREAIALKTLKKDPFEDSRLTIVKTASPKQLSKLLLNAARTGDEWYAKQLIGAGADTNTKKQTLDKGGVQDGFTPLMIAPQHGHKELASLLIQKGAKIEATTAEGITPLMLAAVDGHKNLVSLLIDKGANIEATTVYGFTPLMLAALKDHKDLVSFLIEKGANIEATNQQDQTPLMLAAQWGHIDFASLLIEKGAKVEATTAQGFTPLMLAAQFGHKNFASLLIEKGAKIEATTARGTTPLMLAALKGHKELVSLLIDKGANIEATTAQGFTPLMIAAGNGYKELTSLLIDKGANIEATDRFHGQTPLGIAVETIQQESTKVLVLKGATITDAMLRGTKTVNEEGIEGIQEILIQGGAYEHRAGRKEAIENALGKKAPITEEEAGGASVREYPLFKELRDIVLGYDGDRELPEGF